MGIREMLERRRTRKILRKYLTPEQAEGVLRSAARQWDHFETKHFQFVLILVDETDSKEIPKVLSRVVDTVLDHGGCVSDITVSLVVGLLGEPFAEGNSPEARRALVEALLRENGDRIRILHGECDAGFGNLGSKRRCAYGPVIPKFPQILKTLIESQPGTAVEIPPSA